ncbi:MAG TPA: hypothetical protein EYG71_07635 [Leucothrix sp.]|nr:hypothetical protein [Leucothrix sp.]
MATVYISQKFSGLVEMLSKNNVSETGQPVFKTNMHLTIFSSLLGQNLDGDYSRYTVKNQGSEIPERIFIHNQMDSAVYLLALHAKKDGDILREKNDNESWKITEQYAECGFKELNNWFLDSPGSSEVDVILNKMKEEAVSLLEQEGEIDPDKIEF